MKRNYFFHFCLLNVPKFLQYVTNNKDADNDWFRLESNKDGTRSVKCASFLYLASVLIECGNDDIFVYRWFGKCWHIHNLLKYEFELEFDVCYSIIHVHC